MRLGQFLDTPGIVFHTHVARPECVASRPPVRVRTTASLAVCDRETAAADNSPEPGRQYLRDTFGQRYWNLRERFISLLEWLAQLGNAAGMEEWHEDSEAARFLLGRLRNDHA